MGGHMPLEARQAAVVFALALLALGIALGKHARYQRWTWRHPGAAALVMGVVVGTFVAFVWIGALGLGEGHATLASAAAAGAATASTYSRLTR